MNPDPKILNYIKYLTKTRITQNYEFDNPTATYIYYVIFN